VVNLLHASYVDAVYDKPGPKNPFLPVATYVGSRCSDTGKARAEGLLKSERAVEYSCRVQSTGSAGPGCISTMGLEELTKEWTYILTAIICRGRRHSSLVLL
jgi:hypothetical protein